MASLKSVYSTIVGEDFPDTMTITFGSKKFVYKKRTWDIGGEKRGLRYGDNPDQPAALYRLVEGDAELCGIKLRGPDQAIISSMGEEQMIQAGKHPGKTNLTDVDNGAYILQYLASRPACVILKHNNPCGAAWAAPEDGGIAKAISRAYWSDRIAAFGGAVVINSPLNLDGARLIADNYFEVVAAPAFEEGTIDLVKSRKNLRILELPALASLSQMAACAFIQLKSLSDGGIIVEKSFQNRILTDADFLPATASTREGLEVSARFPDKTELADLLFAWAVEAGVSSNSVIFAKNGATVAIGAGEQDRVGCVELAIHKAYTKYADMLAFKELNMSLYELERQAANDGALKERLEDIRQRTNRNKGGLVGSRLVSDGFFPFRDGVDTAIAQGVTAIAQPGGSLRDTESIIACNEAVPQVAMAFTGQRSFRH